MTPEDINQAIAEWAGSKHDFYHDLNAVHEAEAKLVPGEAGSYDNNLRVIVGAGWSINGWTWRATAPQRCEALLKTLKLWKD